MKQKIYQVDAFTDKVFEGNPAAVCPLESWISDELMQKIAMENNLAETAFYVRQADRHVIRWFTPSVEVDLCGHATLASAYVLFNLENYLRKTIHFFSPRSGELAVTQNGEILTLNFPADIVEPVEITHEISSGFNICPQSAYKGKSDFMLVYNNENEIKEIIPFFDKISKLDARGVIVTANGENSDFVSRFFAPQCGINEDPVTGSAHTALTPFWAKKLNRKEMSALQLSKRRGHLICRDLGDRVEIGGRAKLYMSGEITI